MAVAFWILVGLCVWAYAGYPLALWLATRGRRQPWDDGRDPERWPDVSVMLPAHDEEKVLAARIQNLLGLDYPAGRLQVVVGLDGCRDGSAAIADGFASERVKVIERHERKGKTDLLNAMVEASSGEVIVYTDANCRYDRDALRHLLRPLSVDSIGCVIGELSYENLDDPTVGGGEGLYWRLENAIKEWESRLGGTLVANGSIYAMRRSLFERLPGAISDDSVNPLRVLARGRKVVFQRRAVAREKAAARLEEEFGRKARMVTRQLGSHLYVGAFLWPPHPLLAFRLASHKLLRWLVPVFVAAAIGCNLALLDSPLYRATLAALAAAVAAGAAGGLLLLVGAKPPRLLRLAAYFWMVNLAALKGLVDFALGRRRATWRVSATTR